MSCSLVALSIAGASIGHSQSFLQLPFASAYGVSADGLVVAGNRNPTPLAALRWTAADGILHLGAASAEGISADGRVIVGSDTGPFSGMRWTAATGVVPLGTSDKAMAASADGSVVVGGAASGPGVEAFRWTAATGAVPLGFLPGRNASRALATNADGSVVVGDSSLSGPGSNVSEAYRWTQASGMTGLGTLPGHSHSAANGVTGDGRTIVGGSLLIDNARLVSGEAFYWTAQSGMKGLGVLPGGNFSTAFAISADGAVIVGQSGRIVNGIAARPPHGFVWDHVFGMQDLRQVLQTQYGFDVSGWDFTVPTAVSADGRTIVGFNRDANGTTRAFLISGLLVNRLVNDAFVVGPGVNQAIGILGGSGTVQIGAGSLLTVAGNNLSSDPVNFPNSVFTGTIIGDANLVKAGTGSWLFNGASQLHGNVTVNAGSLLLNGSITGPVIVNSGGTLGGIGTAGNTHVNSGGTLSPGNGIGAFNISGNLVLGAGAIYLVEVSPAGADRTNVSGTASLAGEARLVFGPGTYTSNTYMILSAAGGRSGTFDTVTTFGLPATLSASLNYTANDVLLVTLTSQIVPTMSALAGQTFNQKAVAAAQDAAFNTGRPNITALYGLSLAQVPPALDQLSGEVHASTAGVVIDESLYPRSAVLGRLRQASYGGNSQMASLSVGGPQAFAAGDEISALASAKSAPFLLSGSSRDVVFWAEGFGAQGRFDGDGNAARVRRDLAGFFSGVDTSIGTGGRAGIAAGYTGSRNNLDGGGSSNVETGHLAGYGSWSLGSFNLRAGGAYARHTIDTNRTAVFPGFFNTLTAHYEARTGQIFGEAGYGFAFSKIAVEPFAGGAFVHLDTNTANEQGGEAALSLASNSFDAGYSTLGIRAASTIPLGESMVLMPRASLAWQHAFNDITPDARLAFRAAAIPFVVAGTPLARDIASRCCRG